MGQFLVVLSALGFSTLGVFGKMAYESGFTRDQMLFWRFLVAVPFMFALLIGTRSAPKDARSFFKAVLLGMIGIGVEATLYFLTLEHLGAALTGIFLYLYPTFVALISYLFLSKVLTGKKWLCILLSVIGSILTSGVFGAGAVGTINPLKDPMGLLLGMTTGLWYAIYLLVGNRISKDEKPHVISTGITVGALFTFTALAFLESDQTGVAVPIPSGNKAIIAIVGMAIIASAIPLAALYSGMKRIGPILTSILSTLELVFTIVLAAVFLGERLTVMQGCGASLILLSVLLASLLR
jgi:drug/metabolite transporter (DMT)-like permease